MERKNSLLSATNVSENFTENNSIFKAFEKYVCDTNCIKLFRLSTYKTGNAWTCIGDYLSHHFLVL